MKHVLIAGAGIAALECALALRELAPAHVEVELLAPAAELVHRPWSVATPFGGDPAARTDIRGLADEVGIRLRRDALASTEPLAHRVFTRDGDVVAYDVLVVATGARSREAVPNAITFRGPMNVGLVEQAVARVAAQPTLRLAFVAPPGARWPLPLYELALLAATTLRERGVADADIAVMTGEHEPLEVFGPAASEALRAELDRAGVDLLTSAAVVGSFPGAVRLESGGVAAADVVVALPEIVGPRIPGLPHDELGFIRVDAHGHAEGCRDVFAAGDVTAFPVKHGGLAAQQADAVAEAIAAEVGAVGFPEPFRPVLRGMLLTGGRSLYLRTELGAGGRRTHRLLPAPGTATREPLWSPPVKIAGRYLARFLASGSATGPTLQDHDGTNTPDELASAG
jgi:sulfide:quinone oxidoreductase